MRFPFGKKVLRAVSEEEEIDISESIGIRSLHFGTPAVQSAMRLSDPYFLELAYTRAMMAFLLFKPAPENMLMVGLGGGSLAKFCHRQLPQTDLTVVEISQKVTNLARSMFYLPEDDERFRVLHADGAEFMQKNEDGYDVIMLDAYGAHAQPEALTRAEFYAQTRNSLAGDGILVVNLWGSDSRFESYLARIEQAFDSMVLCLPAEKKSNVIVFAFNRHPGNPLWIDLKERARELAAKHGLNFPEFVEELRKLNRITDKRLII